MSKSVLRVFVLPVAVLSTVLFVAGCGGKGNAPSGPTGNVSVARTTAPPSSRQSGAARPSTGASGSAKNCPNGDVAGVIGGQQKCLAANQECQQKAAADYTRYGFDCVQVNGRYTLRKHGQ